MPAALDRTEAFNILSAEIALRQLRGFFRIYRMVDYSLDDVLSEVIPCHFEKRLMRFCPTEIP